MRKHTPYCLTSIPGRQNACQVDKTGQAVYSVVSPLIELSGQPGETSREPINEASRGEVKLASVSPRQNSELPLMRGSFFVEQTTPGGSPFSVILDLYAIRLEAQNKGLKRDCPGGFITGHCANGDRFLKVVYCGKEWCPICNGKWEKGKDMLPSHARRFSRWYPKAQQIGDMGYWTFTIPLKARGRFRTKEALTELGHQVQELLKKNGFKRGFKRWHFFGDKSAVYNPHLNCLVDGRFIGGKELRAIRREYSKLLGVKLAIAEYHYFDSPGQKVHALRYVTRATFLDARWDVPMALELRGFHTTSLWGRQLWTGKPVWSLKDLPGKKASGMSDSQAKAVASLGNGECPHDGLPIEWERFQPIRYLWGRAFIPLGAGYYELFERGVPSHRRDGNEYERMFYWHDVIDKALISSGLTPQFGHGTARVTLPWQKLFQQKQAVDEQAWTEILTGEGCDFNEARTRDGGRWLP